MPCVNGTVRVKPHTRRGRQVVGYNRKCPKKYYGPKKAPKYGPKNKPKRKKKPVNMGIFI